MRRSMRLVAALAVVVVAAAAAGAREPVVGLPCEGCEIVFEGMPAEIPAKARIASADEPGEALVIDGVVTDAAGKPAAGIIVYAYHTDAKGIYPEADTRHGRLRAWARTDAEGRYRFDTIRPASYPGTSIPQHVHMHVIEPGRCTYFIGDVLFDDDPNLGARDRERARNGRGGPGVAVPAKDDAGVWHATRDIRLGANVPGYP